MSLHEHKYLGWREDISQNPVQHMRRGKGGLFQNPRDSVHGDGVYCPPRSPSLWTAFLSMVFDTVGVSSLRMPMQLGVASVSAHLLALLFVAAASAAIASAFVLAATALD